MPKRQEKIDLIEKKFSMEDRQEEMIRKSRVSMEKDNNPEHKLIERLIVFHRAIGN